MAVRQVLHFPDPRLHIVASPVEKIDQDIQELVTDMYETMYAYDGVGLAATQIGINLRIFVMDVSIDKSQRICAINPEILSSSGTHTEGEGCLSVPGGYDKIERAAQVKFRALNVEGEAFEIDATGLMAKCVQHEVDHLNGRLFISHLSRLKQERLRDRIKKYLRRTSSG